MVAESLQQARKIPTEASYQSRGQKGSRLIFRFLQPRSHSAAVQVCDRLALPGGALLNSLKKLGERPFLVVSLRISSVKWRSFRGAQSNMCREVHERGELLRQLSRSIQRKIWGRNEEVSTHERPLFPSRITALRLLLLLPRPHEISRHTNPQQVNKIYLDEAGTCSRGSSNRQTAATLR